MVKWEGFGNNSSWAYFKVLSRNFNGEAEEKPRKPVMIAGIRGDIQTQYSRIRGRSTNHSTTRIGKKNV
jgi:hypothetical protein